MSSPPRGPSSRWSRSYAIAIFVCTFFSSLLQAQEPLEEVAKPRLPIHGVEIDSFYIGGRIATQPPTGGYGDVWNFADELGVSVLEKLASGITAEVDELIDAAENAPDHHVILNIQGLDRAGNGREVVFFPFDSADSYYYKNMFLQRAGRKLQTPP